MLKIYEVTKSKTNIKGYWKQGKKLFVDNVKFYYPLNIDDFDLKLELLFNGENPQEAVFIQDDKKAYCHYRNGQTRVFRNKVTLYEKNLSFNKLKKILEENQKEEEKKTGNLEAGLTIFKREDYFKIEFWKD